MSTAIEICENCNSVHKHGTECMVCRLCITAAHLIDLIDKLPKDDSKKSKRPVKRTKS